MSTSDVSHLPLNRAGNRRGMHPNCLKTLIPAKPGEDKFHNKNGYSVTAEVKDILKIRERRKAIAEKMVSESEAGNVPMIRELLDRTEGKLMDTPPPQGDRIIQIIVSSDKAKELTENVANRFLEIGGTSPEG